MWLLAILTGVAALTGFLYKKMQRPYYTSKSFAFLPLTWREEWRVAIRLFNFNKIQIIHTYTLVI